MKGVRPVKLESAGDWFTLFCWIFFVYECIAVAAAVVIGA